VYASSRDRSREPLDLSSVARLVVDVQRAAPCAVVAAARREDAAWRRGLGAAGVLTWDDGAPGASVTTPFDLASVTKPITALTLARLAAKGVLGRDERLGDVVPRLAKTRSARVTLDLLSAHRSGLEAHLKLYAPLVEGRAVDVEQALVLAADARRAGCDGDPPTEGFAPVYSDMGYLLLGLAIEERTGEPLDRVVAREVVEPLGLAIGSARQLRAREPELEARVAPTEVIDFRGGLVRGVVHDENAWVLAGDASAGHAGLFGDAASVAELGVAIVEVLAGHRSDWLTPADLEPLVRTRPGGSLLAGFDRRSGDSPSSGAVFGPRTFGHLGFTGTSLWIDPDRELVGVLLTNRVHPTRDALAIRAARPAAYDAMAHAMGRRS
jgi:CubicO group peptidase (beta-lactamase class C family)